VGEESNNDADDDTDEHDHEDHAECGERAVANPSEKVALTGIRANGSAQEGVPPGEDVGR
jgi:hypothetical protein